MVLGMLGCVFYYAQEKVVFHPGEYSPNDERLTKVGWQRLEFATEDGDQVAYYKSPGSDVAEAPDKLWLMFCGNASLTLDNNFLAQEPIGDRGQESVGFLFIEYPGYGECEGRASRAGIHRSVAASVTRLGKHLTLESEVLWERAACFGHSLGAAVAMESAAEHGIEDVIVVSPFTSIEGMASRITGVPVSSWIRNNFSNEVALAKVVTFEGADVHLFHGGQDRVIPVTMGRSLAQAHPEVVIYREIEGKGHNDILSHLVGDIRSLFYR
jgi:hypothetical protein